jgi:hypothetical protein
VTLMLICDVPVFRSLDSAESARLILYIGSQLVRLPDPGDGPYRQPKPKRKKQGNSAFCRACLALVRIVRNVC